MLGKLATFIPGTRKPCKAAPFVPQLRNVAIKDVPFERCCVLNKETIQIGREEGKVDYVIALDPKDKSISRLHATITHIMTPVSPSRVNQKQTEEGEWVLEDHSMNGVFVNDVRVRVQSLKHGDKVVFGGGGGLSVEVGHVFAQPDSPFTFRFETRDDLGKSAQQEKRRRSSGVGLAVGSAGLTLEDGDSATQLSTQEFKSEAASVDSVTQDFDAGAEEPATQHFTEVVKSSSLDTQVFQGSEEDATLAFIALAKREEQGLEPAGTTKVYKDVCVEDSTAALPSGRRRRKRREEGEAKAPLEEAKPKDKDKDREGQLGFKIRKKIHHEDTHAKPALPLAAAPLPTLRGGPS